MLRVSEDFEMTRALPLSDWSEKQWNEADNQVIVRRSSLVWTLVEDGEPLLIVGVYVPSLISIPELWLLMCHGFNRKLKRNLLHIREHMEELLDRYPRIMVKVDMQHRAGLRFAEFMGFEKVRVVFLSDGKQYMVYEVRRGN